MKRLLLLVGGTSLASTMAAFSPTIRQPTTARVMVHCPAGNREAFVTPPQVRIARGDNIEWRMNGNVVSDSIVISLKSGEQAWPFSGSPSRGGQVARANDARTPGTYSYNVHLLCRIPNEGVREVVIDPDIIID